MSSKKSTIVSQAKLRLPFSNQNRAHFVWHEIKRYLALARLFSNNLSVGLYGKLPPKVKYAVNDLEIIAIQGYLFIESIRLFEKLSQPSFVFSPGKIILKELLNNSIIYLKPLLAKHKLKTKIDVAEDIVLEVNEENLKLAIWNLISTIVDIYPGRNLKISATKIRSSVKIALSLEKITPQIIPCPHNLLSAEILYVPQKSSWLENALSFQVVKLISEKIEGEFVIKDVKNIINFYLIIPNEQQTKNLTD